MLKLFSVEGCENNSSCEKISLFSFPKTKERDEWIKFAKKGKWLPKLNSKICSEHFSRHFFTGRKKRRLQAGAVPSLRGRNRRIDDLQLGKFLLNKVSVSQGCN
jgi:hypothetical protein